MFSFAFSVFHCDIYKQQSWNTTKQVYYTNKTTGSNGVVLLRSKQVLVVDLKNLVSIG